MDKALQQRISVLIKSLDVKVLPQIKELLQRRDEAKAAYLQVQQLETQYRKEKTELEATIADLKAKQRKYMSESRSEDVDDISSQIRTAEGRYRAMCEWLPDPKRIGAEVDVEERSALSQAQRELDSTASAPVRAVCAQFQAELDRVVDLLEEMLQAWQLASAEFQGRHGVNPITAPMLIRVTGDTQLFSRIICPRR